MINHGASGCPPDLSELETPVAEHEIAQPTTPRSSKKTRWLAALDELEEEFILFQQRRGVGGTAHSDAIAARNAPKQVAEPEFGS
jgi:hypothetical protein